MQEQISRRIDGLQFRAALWAAFAVIVAIGFAVVVVLFVIQINESGDQTFFLKEWLGAAGAVCFLSTFGCLSLLLLILAALMAWRNSAAIHTEQRHAEILAAQAQRDQN